MVVAAGAAAQGHHPPPVGVNAGPAPHVAVQAPGAAALMMAFLASILQQGPQNGAAGQIGGAFQLHVHFHEEPSLAHVICQTVVSLTRIFALTFVGSVGMILMFMLFGGQPSVSSEPVPPMPEGISWDFWPLWGVFIYAVLKSYGKGLGETALLCTIYFFTTSLPELYRWLKNLY